jgi:hypothetical protein
MSLSEQYTSHDFSHETYYPAQDVGGEAVQGFNSLNANINYDQITTVTTGIDASISTSSFGSYSTTELAEPKFAGDILGTAKNNGSAAQGNLKPNSVCLYQGMEVSLEQLERMGVVYRHPDSGRYIDPNSPNNASTGTQPTPHTPDPLKQDSQDDEAQRLLEAGVELFDHNTEKAYAESVDHLPEAVFTGTISKVIANGLEDLNYSDIARDSGMSTEQAYTTVQNAHQMFTNQANTIAKSLSVSNPQECWDWLQANKPQQLAAAQQALVRGRSTSELKAAIKVYTAKVPASAELMNQRGYETKKGHNGEVLIKVGGMWTTPRAAKASGLIN